MFASQSWARPWAGAAIGLVLLTLLLGGGCSRYNRMAKSRVVADRDSAAFFFYRKGKLDAASLLFEDLLTSYRGTPRAATITYYYAKTLYDNGMYLTAANYFQQYVDQYPNGDYTQEALLNVAKAYDELSLDHEKDQAQTVKAIEQYELFRSIYPNSNLSAEAKQRVDALRERLARKAYEAAELYYRIRQYRAAVTTAKNVLNDHPNSSFREPAQFLLLQSEAAYAENSITQRQLERYREAAVYYERFIARFPNSSRLRDAERIYQDVSKAIQRLERDMPTDTTQLLDN